MTDELRRQAYLEAMGVECYLPRLLLPGARPSALCEMPDWLPPVAESQPGPGESAGAVAASAAAGNEPAIAGRSGAADIQQLLDGTDVPKRAARAPTDIAATRQRSGAAIPRFSLSLVRAGRILLVDDGLGRDVDPQLYLHLLHSLLFALGGSAPEPSLDAFNWPLARVRGGHVDQSQTAAREALTAYLDKQLQQGGAQYLLLMGDTTAGHVLGEAAEGGRRNGELLSHPQLSARCLVTASAARALSEPALKPVIWRDVQPLVAAMKSH